MGPAAHLHCRDLVAAQVAPVQPVALLMLRRLWIVELGLGSIPFLELVDQHLQVLCQVGRAQVQ